MAEPSKEKDYSPTDPVGGADSTNHEEPLDVDGKEKEYIEINTHRSASNSSNSGSEFGQDEKKIRPGLQQTKSYATDASALSRTDSQVDVPAIKKPWYKKINPLKWGKIPPVPETRRVSREYNAPFLSLVYFQWMAPLMSVSISHTLFQKSNTNAFRLDTSDNSNRMTFGP